MKILFAVRSLAHFSYIQSVVEALGDHRIELLFDKEWNKYSTDEHVQEFVKSHMNVSMDWLVTLKPNSRKRHSFFREFRSYISYIGRDQSGYYLKRWRSYLPLWARIVLRFKPIRVLFPYLEKFLVQIEKKTAPFFDALLDLSERNPDILFVIPVMHRYSGEIEYLKAAKLLGIPTVSMALSWDCLTTKGIFHVVPDTTFVWNETQQKEAIDIHGIPKETIKIIGAPFFDKWFHHRDTESRKEFCDRVGLNYKKPFVLYLGSSCNIAENENWLIKSIYDGLEGISLLVRPHPANSGNYIKLVGNDFTSFSNNSLKIKDDLVVYPLSGALPETEADQKDFYTALKQCVCVVAINTSGMIDAVVNGKPCIAYIADKYNPTQTQTTHFKQMLGADILEVAHTPEEVLDIAKSLARGEDTRWESRREFVRKFIRSRGFDIEAGELAAGFIKNMKGTGWAERDGARSNSDYDF